MWYMKHEFMFELLVFMLLNDIYNFTHIWINRRLCNDVYSRISEWNPSRLPNFDTYLPDSCEYIGIDWNLKIRYNQTQWPNYAVLQRNGIQDELIFQRVDWITHKLRFLR
jgi:hypothetical protein